MKNDYKINGVVTEIYMKNRNGDIFKTIIDTEDFKKADEFKNTWCVHRDNGNLYVVGAITENGKRKTIKMHRLLKGFPEGMIIDHFNHDTLDNRQINLKVVSKVENSQNRSGAQRNSLTGVRGVEWVERTGKWRARLRKDKRDIHIGYFHSKEEADRAVKEAREKYFPYLRNAHEAGRGN